MSGNGEGNPERPRDSDWPSSTRARTAASSRRAPADSVCSMRTLRHSSIVRPARSRVANWRVRSARPLRDRPGREKRSRTPACSAAARIASTASGASPRSRSSVLAWRSVSASMTPRFSRPPASSALYSKPDIGYTRELLAAHAQHFLEAGFAGLHPAHSILPQAFHALRARVIAQVGFRGAVVDQAPRFVIDQQQLEDAAAALVARERARLASGGGVERVRRATAPAFSVAVAEQRELGGVGLVRLAAR